MAPSATSCSSSVGELVQLGAARRGGAAGRCRGGAPIDYARQIDEAWLDGVATIGVTSGASVPEVLVRGVSEHLAERGWGDVEELTTAEETLTFALPRELRPARAGDFDALGDSRKGPARARGRSSTP